MIYPFSKINYLILEPHYRIQTGSMPRLENLTDHDTLTANKLNSGLLLSLFLPLLFYFQDIKRTLFCIVSPALKKGVCTLFTGSSSPSHLDLLRVRGRVRLGSPRAWLLFLPLLLLLLPLGPQLSPWTATDMKTNDEDGCWLDPHTELTLATIATNDSSAT